MSRSTLTDRDKYLRRKYGITEADYNRMLAKHGGSCWICSAFPKTRRLNVDHDHKTGKVRGLLCFKCNKFLLHYSVDPERLRKAADYLEKAA